MINEESDADCFIGENLPRAEMEELVIHMVAAIDRACRGCWSEGYAILVAGLRDAEEHRAQGQPWGIEAVRRYRRAISNYCRRYMVPLA